MYRFVGIIWDSGDPSCTQCAQMLGGRLQLSSPDWQFALKCDGLSIFHSGTTVGATEVYKLHDDAGVVLGKLFPCLSKDGASPSRITFNPNVSKAIIDTRGRHLADNYWGRYIAFLWDRHRQQHYVVRDPTGGLPCLFAEVLGVRVFMSGMEEYVALEGDQRCVNWKYLAALFWNLRLISRDTGFEGVSQLYAGECLVIRKNGTVSTSFCWEPKRVYEAGPLLEEANDARATLKLAVRSSIASWASCYKNIIHQLSGGLDSSIVAACLSSAPNRENIVCINLSTETLEGDERYFARLTASKACLTLIEEKWIARNQPLESMLDTGKHFTPFGLYTETDRLLERLSHERQAPGIFSGHGGDHLFQQHSSVFIAAEFVSRRGLHAELGRIVADTSRLTSRSFWTILRIALTYGLLRRTYDPYAAYSPSIFLTSEARAGLTPDTLIHPWLVCSTRLPTSKIEQIALIVDSQHFYLRDFSFADAVHPLISQPVIDCCLRIPTYILTRGGIRRSLIREAFRKELPSQIVTRTTKGGTTSFLNRLAVENVEYLRDLLLDGLLVSARLLDKRKLESQLSESRLIRGEQLPDVFLAARTEAWLRGWARTWPNCVS